MAITAAMVKELRERTGSGMMECKKALVESDGDIDAAIEAMRKSGLAKADKRSGKTAAEGVIAVAQSDGGNTAVMVEVNCETDFVSRGDDFVAFANSVADSALNGDMSDIDGLLAASMDGGSSVDTAQAELSVKIGEKISVRRFVRFGSADSSVASYLHGSRIGVVVEYQGGDETIGKDVAMHVAASNPICVAEDDVPAEMVAKEKEIFSEQAAQSGKPADIIEKMVVGKIRKFLAGITLLGQPFIKDPDMKVGKMLDKGKATVVGFQRFEVGEGIEKKQENFAEEVMAQIKG